MTINTFSSEKRALEGTFFRKKFFFFFKFKITFNVFLGHFMKMHFFRYKKIRLRPALSGKKQKSRIKQTVLESE